jgi:F0F1-type ATP synthase gamma subunit
VVGSQKGLVSNFNRRLIKLVEMEMDLFHPGKPFNSLRIYVVTNKPSYYQNLLSQTAYQVEVIPFVYDLTFSDAVKLFDQIPAAGSPADDIFYFYNTYGKSQNSSALKQAALRNRSTEPVNSHTATQWPPYILDSEASAISEWIQNMLTYLEFQEVLTNSIASENSFRHRILEEAKNNTDRLIHELTIEISMSRKKEITKEIQELAVAAGLIQ